LLRDLRGLIRREVLWARHLRTRERLFHEHPLRYLFFEVTRRCNYSCAYCGSDCSVGGVARELDVLDWIRIARQVATDFRADDVMIAVTGGEPLLKKGIFELFAELHRLGFHYGMVTNGSLLDEVAARRLVEAGIGSISISMDAPSAVNDALRGPGAAARVEAALAALRCTGYSGKLEIISTVTRPAVPLLPELRKRLFAMNVPRWRVAPVMPIGRAAHRPDLVPDGADIRSILEFVRTARSDGLLPRPEFCEEGFLGNRFEGVVRPYLSMCGAGITTAGILCDGRIGACPELGEAFLQGDIKTDRLREVWDNRYQVLRDRSWTLRGICGACEHYERCGGGAMHLYSEPGADILRCLYRMARAPAVPSRAPLS